LKNNRLLQIGCLIAVGVAVWLVYRSRNPLAVLDDPDQLILYSIRGDAYRYTRNVKSAEDFHGFPVLGKMEIREAEKRGVIAAALKQGIASASGDVIACFWPRHGLRVVSNSRTVDYLICFECEWVYIFEESSERRIHVNNNSQAVFDQSLREVGLTLAKDVPPDRQ